MLMADRRTQSPGSVVEERGQSQWAGLEGRIGNIYIKKPTNWVNFTYCKKTRGGSILWFVVQTSLHRSGFYGEKIDNIR